MKNKLRIIIIVLLVLIVLCALMYVIYEKIYLSKLPSVTGIIVYKDNEEITIKSSVDTTELEYNLDIENDKMKVKDINGKEISISNLNIGDTIKALYKVENNVDFALAYHPEKINNIKIIKVIEDNSDNHMTEDDLSYNYYVTQLSLSNEKNLAFIVYETNGNYPIKTFFSSDIEIKIVKKEENDQKIIVKHYKSSEISYKKYIDDRGYKITIDNANFFELEDELEEGKYVLRIENKNGDIIKIPFKKNQSGSFQW